LGITASEAEKALLLCFIQRFWGGGKNELHEFLCGECVVVVERVDDVVVASGRCLARRSREMYGWNENIRLGA
jgi:hypothetical protein